MRKVLQVVLGSVLLCGLAACTGSVPPGGDDTNEEMAAALLDAPTNVSGELSLVGSTTVQPLVEALGEAYIERYPDVSLSIGAGGSRVGIEAIQNGTVDIGMSSRNLRAGETTDGMVVDPIAIDVLAVIVHPSNEVADLTRAELKAIFTGEITNWSEVGGADRAILPVIREVTSGTRGAFDEIALDDAAPTRAADVQVTAGEAEARVAATENAIGYVGFGHIERDEINVVAIDGVEPSPESAQNDEYALKRPLLLLTGPLSRDLAQTFIDFALSEDGQAIVREGGWVPANGCE